MSFLYFPQGREAKTLRALPMVQSLRSFKGSRPIISGVKGLRLGAEQSGVPSVLRHQLRMGPAFHQTAPFHVQDPIAYRRGGQPVGHEQNRLIPELPE